jgi:uncharacterized membrane protein YcgQ (UPF0703/DUF1980 family)
MKIIKTLFLFFPAALTVFVVNVESLKATSLIHAGKFTKLLNMTANANSTTTTEGSSDNKEAQVEVADKEVSSMHNNASTQNKKVSKKRLTGQL